MPRHHDILGELNKNASLNDKLGYLHAFINKKYPFIERIAIAVYDPENDMLRTHVDSTWGESPLHHYEARLSDVSSLKKIADSGQPRVINHIRPDAHPHAEHSRKISARYAASYTLPMYNNGMFLGLIFFDSNKQDCFSTNVLYFLDMVGHLITMIVATELIAVQTMAATLETAQNFSFHRDAETGSHLERMAQYSRLIAQGIADKYDLSDSFIEYVFRYAPLHDIGKIGIPDNVLLKPAKLTTEEFDIMKKHVNKGQEIVREMLKNFKLDHLEHTDILCNIVGLHHESVDGQGYSKGLKGNEIPIEARIIAVADVFDALTSHRPYKEAWSNERAFDMLRELAGFKLDPDCVAALCEQHDKVIEIQRRFAENMLDKESA